MDPRPAQRRSSTVVRAGTPSVAWQVGRTVPSRPVSRGHSRHGSMAAGWQHGMWAMCWLGRGSELSDVSVSMAAAAILSRGVLACGRWALSILLGLQQPAVRCCWCVCENGVDVCVTVVDGRRGHDGGRRGADGVQADAFAGVAGAGERGRAGRGRCRWGGRVAGGSAPSRRTCSQLFL